MSKRQRELSQDEKNFTGDHGVARHGHGFGSRYDVPNRVHDMHLKNAERRPDISHTFSKRRCAKCSLKKLVKGGRMLGMKFVCSDCAPTR